MVARKQLEAYRRERQRTGRGTKPRGSGLVEAWRSLACLAACLCLVSGEVVVGQTRLEPGSQAPKWKDLVGTDGQRHALEDLSEYDFVVVCFTCNTCPYSIDYEDRLIQLQQRYASPVAEATESAGEQAGDPSRPSVAVVAINSNATPEDTLDAMRERAEEKSFPFRYLRDEDQSVARAYRAIYTPEFFVLDQRRRLIYQGALDDATDADQVQIRYVEAAIQAGFSGETPETQYSPARGCRIRLPRNRSQRDR